MATRLPLKSAMDLSGDVASLTKNMGPALAGATIRRAMLLVKGGVASFALPIQLEAMNPTAGSPRSSCSALWMLASVVFTTHLSFSLLHD